MQELEIEIRRFLESKAKEEYRLFSAKLTPTGYEILGVRMPWQKSLAKDIVKRDRREVLDYLDDATPMNFEELNVYGLSVAYAHLTNQEKMKYMNRYFGLIDNWASCDSIVCACKFMGKKLDTYRDFVWRLAVDDRPFVARAGIVSMMTYYLGDEYVDEVLEQVVKIDDSHYYVSMAVAWLVATALAKDWDRTISVLENRLLDKDTHNRAISKARESYRIEPWQKEYLKGLKV
ncbi:MAG: DNA alkylation repair protein [Christensenellales bacterium]